MKIRKLFQIALYLNHESIEPFIRIIQMNFFNAA